MVGGLALAANLVCFLLLYRHRGDNLNMSSVWLCSRNDLIANVAVLGAAAGTFLLASRWPDILVGRLIAGLACPAAVLTGIACNTRAATQTYLEAEAAAFQ